MTSAPHLGRYNDRYLVTKSLGEGGFSRTFLAKDEQTQQLCVLKQLKLHPDPSSYAIIKRGFDREVAILKRLKHPQIPVLYDSFGEHGQFYLVQEYIEGETLQERLDAVGKFDEEAVKQFLIKILPVLNYIHSQNIIHRDIKPANIILQQSDDLPVLIDFGAVKEVMSSLFVSYGKDGDATKIGTLPYMAPEQFVGKPAIASDLYSLGKTAIHLLTGAVPDTGYSQPNPTWANQLPTVSSGFVRVLNKAVKFELDDRFETANEMLAAVNMQTIVSTTTMRQTTVISNSQIRRLLYRWGAGVAALVAVSAVYLMGYRPYREGQALEEIRSLYAQRDFEGCINAANNFLSFNSGRSNTVTNLLEQCTEQQTNILETYLRQEVPQQEESSQISEVLAQLMPTVQLNGDEVIIHYNIDPNSKLANDPLTLKHLTAVYMESLRGNPQTQILDQKYASFSQLVVSPTKGEKQAILHVEQWNEYVERNISYTTLLDKIELIRE
jgi:serine/threonine protein kinase